MTNIWVVLQTGAFFALFYKFKYVQMLCVNNTSTKCRFIFKCICSPCSSKYIKLYSTKWTWKYLKGVILYIESYLFFSKNLDVKRLALNKM